MATVVKQFFKAVSGIIKHKPIKTPKGSEEETSCLIEMGKIRKKYPVEYTNQYGMAGVQAPVFMGVCL